LSLYRIQIYEFDDWGIRRCHVRLFFESK